MILFLLLSIEEDNFVPVPQPPEWNVSAREVYKIMEPELLISLSREPGGLIRIKMPNFEIPYFRATDSTIHSYLYFHTIPFQASLFLTGFYDSLTYNTRAELLQYAYGVPLILKAGCAGRMDTTLPIGSITVLFPERKRYYGFTLGIEGTFFIAFILQVPGKRITVGKDLIRCILYNDKGFLKLEYAYRLPYYKEPWFNRLPYHYEPATSIEAFYWNTLLRLESVSTDIRVFIKRGELLFWYSKNTRVASINGTVHLKTGRLNWTLYMNASGKNLATNPEISGEAGVFLNTDKWWLPSFGFVQEISGERRLLFGLGME